jgi:hypothetical protein
VVFIYLLFFGVSVVYNAVYAFLLGGCSCAFFHLVLASTVWAGIFAFAFIVFMVESATLETSNWGEVIGCFANIPSYP